MVATDGMYQQGDIVLLTYLAGWLTGFTMTAKVVEDDHKQMFVWHGELRVKCCALLSILLIYHYTNMYSM